MSRIHDALKKAELERAAAQALEVGGLPLAPNGAASSGVSQAGVAANNGGVRPTRAAAAGDSLRFEDLRLRRQAHSDWHPDPKTDVFDSGSGSYGAEQFRTLRSRLYQLRSSQPLRTILITSSAAGEGKTFVTSNLARAIVRQLDRRVLIVDCDLRCPRLHVV